MIKLSGFIYTMGLIFVIMGVANAVLVDFESTGLQEGDFLTTQIPGLAFSDTIIAKKGSPPFGFHRINSHEDDTISSFGSFFISDPLKPGGGDPDPNWEGTIEVSFETPVLALGFDAGDLEGHEDLTARAYAENGNLLETVINRWDDYNNNRWDGSVNLIQFSVSNISRLTVTAHAQTGGQADWGIDNLSYTNVPVPGAVWLLGSGLIGLVGLRKKLKDTLKFK